MRLSVVLFLVVISSVLAECFQDERNIPASCPPEDKNIKSLVFPAETSDSYVELVPLRPLNLEAFTLCMRVATELTGWREVILFAYRTQAQDELNMWRETDGSLSFYMGEDGVLFKLPELSALQTHLCFTWDSCSGASAVFINGKKSLTKIFKKGHTVSPGGRVILGQDPDSFLGWFDSSQSFVGEIGDVNMWDSVLPDSSIQDMSSGEEEGRGNVIDWETTELKLNGNVNVIDGEPCSESGASPV